MIRTIDSSSPALKMSATMRFVCKIVLGFGHVLFIVGAMNDFTTIAWYGSAIVIFLCMSIFCGIIALKEYQLKDYASDVYTISLPKPNHDPKFWKRRMIASISLFGSLFLLCSGYVVFVNSAWLAVILIIISLLLWLYHIVEHPKRGTYVRPCDMR